MARYQYTLAAVLLTWSVTWAKVDLVTLPARDTVQLTIYNSADLTLARESRALTLKEGANTLQFSWANTLIDPTSLELLPQAHAGEIDVAELVYPWRRLGRNTRIDASEGVPLLRRILGHANDEGSGQIPVAEQSGLSPVKDLGLWNITSEITGKVPVEISYLTSGLSWRAFYMGTLSQDEKTMRLQAYVRVTNRTGEDYENAQVRLVVGQVHLLDQIATLAHRAYPYNTPIRMLNQSTVSYALPPESMEEAKFILRAAPSNDALYYTQADMIVKPKEVVKEGLSEYFLYTIEGTETIPNGFSKRLLSFDVDAVPIVSLYKYEEDRYGPKAVRFLSFTNEEDDELGQTPIPGGDLKVYRSVDDRKHLSYVGQSSFKYIPVGEEVELNLGPVDDVVVEPKLMEVRSENYRFDRNGNIAGWDDVQVYAVTVKNTRDIPAKVEIRRNFTTPYWTLTHTGDVDEFEKVDVDTVEFTVTLSPVSQKRFEYTLTTYQGVRREDWQRRSR